MVSFKVMQSSESVNKMLKRIKERLNPESSDFSNLKLGIGKIYKDAVLKRFDTEMGPNNRKWKKTSEQTYLYKRYGFHLYSSNKDGDGSGNRKIIKTYKKGSATPDKTLSWTGALRKSIKVTSAGQEIKIYTSLPYAKAMHYGMEKGQNGAFMLPMKKNARGLFEGPWKLSPHGEDNWKYTNYRGVRGEGVSHTPWGKIPARPFLGFELSSNEIVRRKLIKYLSEVNKSYF